MHVAQALIEMEMGPLRPLHAMTHNRRLAVSKHIADSIGLSPLVGSGAEPRLSSPPIPASLKILRFCKMLGS